MWIIAFSLHIYQGRFRSNILNCKKTQDATTPSRSDVKANEDLRTGLITQ